jgi:hypothetical protein
MKLASPWLQMRCVDLPTSLYQTCGEASILSLSNRGAAAAAALICCCCVTDVALALVGVAA